MDKIEKLTPSQATYLPVFYNEWLQVGLSTDRIDQKASSSAVRRLYAACGLSEPTIVHFDSPMQCILAIEQLRTSLKMSKDNLWGDLGTKLGVNLKDNLWVNIWANLGANLRADLKDKLWNNLGTNLRDNLGANLQHNLKSQSYYVETYFWGGLDASWLAWAEFSELIGAPINKPEHFHAYIDFAKSSGVGYFYNEIALVSDRSCLINKDEKARLHCEDGPALAFRDGYKIYAWHGINIPSEWIEKPAILTPKIALTTTNIEQRRAACEILGWHNIIRELGAKVIDDSGDERVGTLLEVKLPGDDEEPEITAKFLHIVCGTGREFAQSVPPKTRSVMEAQAYFQGLPVEIFQLPEIRT